MLLLLCCYSCCISGWFFVSLLWLLRTFIELQLAATSDVTALHDGIASAACYTAAAKAVVAVAAHVATSGIILLLLLLLLVLLLFLPQFLQPCA